EEWLALAQNLLGRLFPGLILAVVRHNVSADGNESKGAVIERLMGELGETMAEYLVENNRLDMCLYQVADALLTRRLAESGVTLALYEEYRAAQRKRKPLVVSP